MTKEKGILRKLKRRIRLIVQIGFVALSNGYINGFLSGTIYRGQTKKLCVPGLNCYSCPGALGSCPIGSLQAVLGSQKYQFSYYIIGIIMAFGAFFGRIICGWLCPFGLVQDILHKIPFPVKIHKVKGEHYLHYLKYIILILFVIIAPLVFTNVVGMGTPWFCKVICPSGTLLGGVPLILSNSSLRESLGFLFHWKLGILLFILIASIIIYRPFCRFLCPLGAIYGCFNKVSFYRYYINKEKCTNCKKCQMVCKMNIPVYETPNSSECIRCGVCKRECPTNAIEDSFSQIYHLFYEKKCSKEGN